MPRQFSRKTLVMTFLIAGTLTLGACREEEQDRFIMYEPGVYKGKKDTPISEAQATELRNRTAQQLGVTLGTGAAGMMTGDIRPPE